MMDVQALKLLLKARADEILNVALPSQINLRSCEHNFLYSVITGSQASVKPSLAKGKSFEGSLTISQTLSLCSNSLS